MSDARLTMPDDPHSPVVTVSALDVPISAETRHDGAEVHLVIGPLTLVLLSDQAVDVVTALRTATATHG